MWMQETGSMRSRWLILVLRRTLVIVLAGGIASAGAASGLENRAWAFDLLDQVHVAGQHAPAVASPLCQGR